MAESDIWCEGASRPASPTDRLAMQLDGRNLTRKKVHVNGRAAAVRLGGRKAGF
jgi:hypothetical protein